MVEDKYIGVLQYVSVMRYTVDKFNKAACSNSNGDDGCLTSATEDLHQFVVPFLANNRHP
jgi:hypothetical protein